MTDANGDATIRAPIGLDPGNDGLSLHVQWVALALVAPGGITTSNGNQIVLRY